MRRSVLLLLLACAATVGTVTGYAVHQNAELVEGTYYIDLGRAIPETPEFKVQLASSMAPLQKRFQELQVLNTQLENDKSQLALMDPNAPETRNLVLSLKIREETIRGEMDLLNQASRNLEEEFLFLASKRIHLAATQMAQTNGYESLVISPIALDKVDWENPQQAMELLRQRSTFWIHPQRDVTSELIAILAQ